MTDDKFLEIVSNSLYGYNYILERENKNDRRTYVQTVYEDIKHEIKNRNENTKKT